MKKFYLSLCLILIVFSSCKDVIESDPNYEQNFVKGKILTNQTTGVIMPLAVENYWIYRVQYFDSIGTVTADIFDTIIVKNKCYAEDLMWYNTVDLLDSNYYLNTETGLMYKYMNCCNEYRFYIPYPTIDNSTIEFEVEKNNVMFLDTNGVYQNTIITTLRNVKSELNQHVAIGTAQYNCIKYSITHKIKEPDIQFTKDWITYEYYQPDLGKVMELFYSNDNSGAEKYLKMKKRTD